MVAFCNSNIMSHLCTVTNLGGQSDVKPRVPTLDSENTIIIDPRQMICNLEPEDMTSSPVNVGKECVALPSLSFPL